jgi:tRNA dimethylallyltransferase
MTPPPASQLEPLLPPSAGRVVAVVGPTAVGKTALAEELALRLGGEIVSADSMQVYRGMDVGTAKPPEAERRVPYRCLDLVDPGTPYSAALYQADARSAIGDVHAEGRVPVVCGGTGLYVRAALDDMRFPAGDTATSARARYDAIASAEGAEALHALLAERDSASAALLHPNNVRRVVRALEMLDEEGVSYAEQAAGFRQRESVYDAMFIGLEMERAELYARIDQRVDAMLAAGLLDEVRRLLEAGYREALTAAQAIGYKELVPVVDGETGLEEAAAAIQQATRRYAKRQLTWFRADPRIAWLDVTELSPAEAADEAERLVESSTQR